MNISDDKADEMRVLAEMLISASDHVLGRYPSERDQFDARARELADHVLEMLGPYSDR